MLTPTFRRSVGLGLALSLALVACGGATTEEGPGDQSAGSAGVSSTGQGGTSAGTGGTAAGTGGKAAGTGGTAAGTGGAAAGTGGTGSAVGTGGTGGSVATGGTSGSGGAGGTVGGVGGVGGGSNTGGAGPADPCQAGLMCSAGQSCTGFPGGDCMSFCKCTPKGQYVCTTTCGGPQGGPGMGGVGGSQGTGGSGPGAGGTSPVSCGEGVSCQGNGSCGFANGICSTSCQCFPDGLMHCTTDCSGTGGSSAGGSPGTGGSGPIGCSQGQACPAGSGCGSPPGPDGCSFSCDCDDTGHLQCSEVCSGEGGFGGTGSGGFAGSSTSSCGPGEACTPGSGCGATSPDGCFYSCACDSSGHYVCDLSCGGEGGAGGSGGFMSCAQPGQVCSPGEGCGSGGDPSGCSSSCSCDDTGHFNCKLSCNGACPPQAPSGYLCGDYPVGTQCSYLPNTSCVCSATPGGQLWQCALLGRCETGSARVQVRGSGW
jgi:hypothetical protein